MQGGPQVSGRPLLLAGKIQFYMGGNMLQADKQGNLTQKANQYNSLRQYPVDILNMQLSALNGTQLPTGTSSTICSSNATPHFVPHTPASSLS